MIVIDKLLICCLREGGREQVACRKGTTRAFPDNMGGLQSWISFDARWDFCWCVTASSPWITERTSTYMSDIDICTCVYHRGMRLLIQGPLWDVWMCEYLCVGTRKYRFNKVFFHSHEYRAASLPPPSIKHNSGIIIAPLSSSLSFILRPPPLLSRSISPLICQAHFSADIPCCLLLISLCES